MNERFLSKAKIIVNPPQGKEGWVTGYYYYGLGDTHNIVESESTNDYEIVPTTLSQCTGLKDRHGALIFENDQVEVLFSGFSDDRDAFVSGNTTGKVVYVNGVWCVAGDIGIALRACYEIEIKNKEVQDATQE